MIKGKYVATIYIDFHINEKLEGLLPMDKMKRNICDGGATEAIRNHLLYDWFDDNIATIRVIQKEADFWKEDEHDD